MARPVTIDAIDVAIAAEVDDRSPVGSELRGKCLRVLRSQIDTRSGQSIVAGLYAAFADGVELSTDVLLQELTETKPLSVTRHEEVQALRTWASGRAVPAGDDEEPAA